MEVGAVVVPQKLLIQRWLAQSEPALHFKSSAHGGQSPPPQSVSVSLPSLFSLVHVATEGMGVGSAVGAVLIVGSRLGDGVGTSVGVVDGAVLIVGSRLGDGVGTSVGVVDGGRDASVTASELIVVDDHALVWSSWSDEAS